MVIKMDGIIDFVSPTTKQKSNRIIIGSDEKNKFLTFSNGNRITDAIVKIFANAVMKFISSLIIYENNRI